MAKWLGLVLCALALAAASPSPPVVQVTGGSVRGTVAGDGSTLLFRGIPFAAPPVENLRWKPPQPVIPWSGVRDASGPTPACIQNDQGWNHEDYLSGREDCLTLDVGTQALTGRRPVLVWIHGGSNRAGSPGGMITSPIARDGIVLVGIRYRLGIFGFLSHPALSRESGGSSGNYALMDQIAALRWVRANIAKFGGDPDDVTIAGESAGSQDVSLLLAAPAARGLFRQAIMESGTPGFGMPFRSLREAERIGEQADDLLQAGGDIDKLRHTSVPALLTIDLKLHDAGMPDDSALWLRTAVDGAVLPKSPRDLIAEGPARPVLLGTNRLELDMPGGRTRRDEVLVLGFGPHEAEARAFYRNVKDDPRLGTLDQQIATDLTFRCPAGALATLLSEKGAPVWRYEFDLAPGGGHTSHAAEISYVFGESRSAAALSLRPYWVNFVKTGDPNGAGLVAWPRFTPEGGAHMAFEEQSFHAAGPLRPQPCNLVDRL
ncbi:MAG TPA: carboxylesterase family protein [Allosphingosinicella sp.]|jgi:para-nitrobenzyl esterase|nr:carboxylesterase family protein [Allosphingosinicella sp.]